jgi:ABC-type antimicrobial peptide transport system permease subunit
MTIVGVVADVRERGADLASKPAVYVPFTQTGISFFQPSEIAVRTSVDPLSMANALRRAVWSVDAQEPVSAIRTLDDIVDADLLERRQVLTLVAVFSAVALLLAAVGLYSVLSYLVADTRRDIGIRLAIGASPRLVVAGIVRQAAWLTAAGIAAGIAGAGALTRLMQGLLFEVSPVDPRVIGAVSVLLAAVALLAAYLPARRAASTDPATVLRTE